MGLGNEVPHWGQGASHDTEFGVTKYPRGWSSFVKRTLNFNVLVKVYVAKSVWLSTLFCRSWTYALYRIDYTLSLYSDTLTLYRRYTTTVTSSRVITALVAAAKPDKCWDRWHSSQLSLLPAAVKGHYQCSQAKFCFDDDLYSPYGNTVKCK